MSTEQGHATLPEKSELSVLEETTRRFPARLKLEKLQERTSEKKEEDSIPLSILVITWNLMGTLPSKSSVELLLNKQRLSNDLIVIGR